MSYLHLYSEVQYTRSCLFLDFEEYDDGTRESWYGVGGSICTCVTLPLVTVRFSSASGLKARFNQNYCNISDLFDHCASKHSPTNNGSSSFQLCWFCVYCRIIGFGPGSCLTLSSCCSRTCTNCWVTQSIICQFLCYLQFCASVFVWVCMYEWSCLFVFKKFQTFVWY